MRETISLMTDPTPATRQAYTWQSTTNRYTSLARIFSFFFDASIFLIRTAQQASWTAFPYSSVLQVLRSTRRPHIQQNEAEHVLPSGVGVSIIGSRVLGEDR